MKYFSVCLLVLVIEFTSVAKAQSNDAQHGDVATSGFIAANMRDFIESPMWSEQISGKQISLLTEPDIRWTSNDRELKFQFTPSIRWDSRDSERNKFDLKEAYLSYHQQSYSVNVGINQVFWGVTESRHLVNIINQVDALEDVSEESFFGQLMLQGVKQTELGEFSFYLMTGFKEREFTHTQGRLRTLATPIKETYYQSKKAKWQPEIALRYSHYFGDFDLGLHYFHGINREPNIDFNGTDYTAFYSNINQLGLDLQYTDEALLFKLEAIYREGQGRTFSAYVAGVEYSFFQVNDSDLDISILVEQLKDHRDHTVYSTPFNNDFFVGSRIALNDVNNTSALIGLYIDKSRGMSALRAEFETRLGQSWKLTLEGQFFLEDEPQDVISLYQKDSFIDLQLSYHF